MEGDRAPAGEFQFLDPNLEEKLVNELKAQGVFDQFRKDCLSDVDTKPAYQNLRNRVDKSVSSYLGKTNWRPSLNKNQLRNQLRKYIQDMSSVEAGVDRIVDQIVNPKLNSTLLPEVEEVIYKCFGTTKEEVADTDLVNGNDDEAASHSNQNGASNHHEDPQAGKISARNLSAISSDAEMMNLEAGRSSVSSSPGPGLAGHVSPLTPGASPSVNRGDISPLTPANTPPPPPPGEDKTEEVGMEVDVEEERPGSAYTPPLPAPAVPATESPSYTPPLVASPAPVTPTLPPPPPPPPESGGEASMSSISDTDLGDVSPPRPAPAPAPAPPPNESPGSGSGSDEDLQQLMKMKAELMAQLEGDFKLSPEESDDEDELEEPAEKTEPAPGPSVSSGSPSPPPATTPPASSPPAPTPPGEEMSKLSVEEPSGCKPYSSPESKSPSSGDGGSGPGPSSGPPPPSSTAGASSDSGRTGEGQQETGAGKGQEEQRSHSKHHSSSSSRHHSSSMSKEEKKKYDKLKEHHKAKIEKYEQKIKSKDKLKSDKYQDLDIFSNTKKPGTPHLPTARGHGSGSSSSSTPKPQKKEFEKKLDEEIRKELERREEKRKEKQHSDMRSFKTPVKVEDRRSSSDKERSDKKERRSSKDDRHDSHSSRHRHDSDRKHKDRRHSSSSDKERRHSSSSSSSGEKRAKERRSSTDSKYSKERELQEVESKRRLQEARMRREREEKEKSRSHEKDKRSKDYEKNRKKPKDEINDLLKEKISSLGVDNIQKMLMESLMEKTGAKVSDEEKQKMMAKMEDIIKEKKPATESPPVTKKIQSRKVSPKKKRNSSGATSSSSSSPSLDSEDEIKEMKLKVKSSGSKAVSRPVRIRKVRTFDEVEDKSDSDGDFVKPVKSDGDNASVSEPEKVSQKLPVEEKKQISIAAIKKIDDDPKMPSMNGFSLNEVGKTDSIIEKLRELLTDEDSIDIEPVTEVDINNAIPTSRVVQLDPGTEPEALIQILSKFGGNPRLTTPVPDWLNPYLVGAKVKTEDVEMPTMEEVREHLLKKNSGKRKRGAGWDIVVDWVPQEQPAGKRSKIEKELGFDFDSSFGCSINVGEGRRSRRSNTKYTTTSEEPVKKSKTVAKVTTKTEEEEKSSKTSAAEESCSEGSLSEETCSEKGPSEETCSEKGPAEETCSEKSPAEETCSEKSPSEESCSEKGPSEEVCSEKSPSEETCSDGSPSKKRRSRDIIAAYLTSAGAVRDDDNEGSTDDTGKTLAKLDAEIEAADQELESVLTTLKNRRKRPVSGDGKFHGWESSEARVVKKTALSSGETNNLHLEEGGAAFGLSELDFVTEETDPSPGPCLLEVVFSEPMLRDVQRLTGPKGITQIKSVPTPPDSDQDDLGIGSSSPDSYGSSKENDPEIVNSVTTIYKQSKGSSARKKSNVKNPVLKAQLEVK